MKNRGSLVVLMLLAAGLIVSGVAVWYHRQQTQRPLELWTTAGSLLIERAPQVTLFRLQPVADQTQIDPRRTIHLLGRDLLLADDRNMEGAAGFSHVRWGLCQDTSYVWEKGCDTCESPRWDYALRFANGDQQITLAFDTRCGLIAQVGGSRCVSIEPIAKEVAAVLED